jgi:hypothetical protein
MKEEGEAKLASAKVADLFSQTNELTIRFLALVRIRSRARIRKEVPER